MHVSLFLASYISLKLLQRLIMNIFSIINETDVIIFFLKVKLMNVYDKFLDKFFLIINNKNFKFQNIGFCLIFLIPFLSLFIYIS
jgi:hypothetical protein